jgi:hypothetical protein
VVCLLGLVLAVTGYFGPWVPHKTAALTLTGLELAEFAKDAFPHIVRELFYLPLIAAFVLLALLASRSTVHLVRLTAPLFAAILLTGVLFPFSVVDSIRQALTAHSPLVLDPRYTAQLALVVVGTVLTLFSPLAHRLPQRAWGVLIALLALAGVVPALWQFALLRSSVVVLYDAPLGLGWGLVACVVGFGLLLLGGASRHRTRTLIRYIAEEYAASSSSQKTHHRL